MPYYFQVNIESGDVDGVLKVLRKSSHGLCTSIKFGMFMKNLISGYSHVVSCSSVVVIGVMVILYCLLAFSLTCAFESN